jgi:hypothetical protein
LTLNLPKLGKTDLLTLLGGLDNAGKYRLDCLLVAFTPPEASPGTACRFNAYHLRVRELESLFPLTVERVR